MTTIQEIAWLQLRTQYILQIRAEQPATIEFFTARKLDPFEPKTLNQISQGTLSLLSLKLNLISHPKPKNGCVV